MEDYVEQEFGVAPHLHEPVSRQGVYESDLFPYTDYHYHTILPII